MSVSVHQASYAVRIRIQFTPLGRVARGDSAGRCGLAHANKVKNELYGLEFCINCSYKSTELLCNRCANKMDGMMFFDVTFRLLQ